ncbi:DNA-3-methyladenine glycosylase family protein [Thermosediminibacter oceani]|uniref:DNA-3-methyladenine glycosylase II n=1 Tax=Thermosediminibacter oceani (strain ATCC BAA-1034 / DSM 16646 / JW/IW-1228P) TaxID=555079 RepID=D9S0B6_THEOJ|nr:DNA-3-methyladenine glycosylase [Thermosediminibacter oceani]ADL07044.1 HhH-GPD family protein [Thermosediminibacter oceani DSM 16646]
MISRKKILRFQKDDPALKALSKADEKMAYLIHLIGDYSLELEEDYFQSLVQSIVGQQLSMKAADSIWRKLQDLCGEVTPARILSLSEDELRSAGLSKKKIEYIKDLSEKVLSGILDLDKIDSMADEEVIEALVRVKGIGRWTAEMFLIFSLGRPDVFSVADLGLQRAVKWLYGLSDWPDKKFLIECSQRWKPYRTAASLYLWEAKNRGIVDEKDVAGE